MGKIKTFYYIYIVPQNNIPPDDITKKMNLCLDWFRFNMTSWVVYSTLDLNKLYARFEDLVKPEGNILIIKMNPNEGVGYMKKSFWEWVKKNRSADITNPNRED